VLEQGTLITKVLEQGKLITEMLQQGTVKRKYYCTVDLLLISIKMCVCAIQIRAPSTDRYF